MIFSDWMLLIPNQPIKRTFISLSQVRPAVVSELMIKCHFKCAWLDFELHSSTNRQLLQKLDIASDQAFAMPHVV